MIRKPQHDYRCEHLGIRIRMMYCARCRVPLENRIFSRVLCNNTIHSDMIILYSAAGLVENPSSLPTHHITRIFNTRFSE